MMRNILKLPYEVTLYMVKSDKWDKKDPFVTFMEDSYKITKSIKESLKRKIITYNNYGYKSRLDVDDLDEVTILNNDFKIEILDPFSDFIRYNHYTDDRTRNLYYPVILFNDELSQKYDYTIICYVEVESLIKIVSNSISNFGAISNSLCFGLYKDISKSLILEENTKDFKYARKEGMLLKTRTKEGNSKWIPGHKYIIDYDKSLIYLGKLESCLDTRNYFSRSHFYSNLIKLFPIVSPLSDYTNNCKFISGDLYLDIDLLSDESFCDIKRYIEDSPNLSIKDIISFIINFRATRGDITLWEDFLIVNPGNKIKIYGLDMGEVFKNDCDNLDNFLSEFCYDLINTIDNNKTISIFISKVKKDVISKDPIITNKIKSLIKYYLECVLNNFYKYTYYGIKSGSTEYEILETIKKYEYFLYWILYNKESFIKIPEDEILNIVKEVKNKVCSIKS